MTKIPRVLHEHINTAFPVNVCLVATVLPDGFAQVTPRGSTMVFDDDSVDLTNRQQVLERLSLVTLPQNVNPQLAPDASPTGQIYF